MRFQRSIEVFLVLVFKFNFEVVKAPFSSSAMLFVEVL